MRRNSLINRNLKLKMQLDNINKINAFNIVSSVNVFIFVYIFPFFS